jgi:hypothetical protein
MRGRRLRGCKNTIEIRLRIAKRDIASDRFAEDVIFLKHRSDVHAYIAIIESL